MLIDLFWMVVGLALLLGGGEFLVRAGSDIAYALGMSRFLVGMTIIALGTSAPELAICLDAAFKGQAEIAVGNIVGSNISNILLIFGITSSLFPFCIEKTVVQREVPIVIGVSLLFLALAADETLSPIEGVVLVACMLLFVIWQVRTDKPESKDGTATVDADPSNNATRSLDWFLLGTNLLLLLIGVAGLWLGARWLVESASSLAMGLGVSKMVIGLTIVAIGSSAPEIVTSLVAVRKGQPELAVGNVLGSNIANLLLVGGATSVISNSVSIPSESLQFEFPVMVVSAIACLPIFAAGHRLDRWEGILFLGCYLAFNMILFVKPAFQLSLTWPQLMSGIVLTLVVATTVAVILHKRTVSRSARAAESQ